MSKNFLSLSKGRTLLALQDKINKFQIPITEVLSVNDFLKNNAKIDQIISIFKKKKINKLAIRSSSFEEDQKNDSKAGVYKSFLNISTNNKNKIKYCINEIIKIYKLKNKTTSKDEIIIQEMVKSVLSSGVVFTHDINNGAPYYIINYDDTTGLTNTVTSGSGKFSNKSLYVFREGVNLLKSTRFIKLINSVKELEKFLDNSYLDIEFVIDKKLNPILLQVRPISKIKKWNISNQLLFNNFLKKTNNKIKKNLFKFEKQFSAPNYYGQMPDWNPVEMIGLHPRPLSYSIYKDLITNKTWKNARKIMGYKFPKENNLMMDFAGQPYINFKLSLISFLPKKLPLKLSNKILNFWMNKLTKNPKLHDKIEFNLAITCFSFDFKKKIKQLMPPDLDRREIETITNSYLELTRNCLSKNTDFSLDKSLQKINQLSILQKKSHKKSIENMLKECRNYGTLYFAILARHAFIATTILRSLKIVNIISEQRINLFLNNISTVATEMIDEYKSLNLKRNNKKNFINKYGHLRPGTYDINSKRYDQTNKYFVKSAKNIKLNNKKRTFKIKNIEQKKIDKLIKKYKLGLKDSNDLFNYIEKAIQLREYSKFVFTKSVSSILEKIAILAKKKNMTRDQISYLKVEDLKKNNQNIFSKFSQQKNDEILNSVKLPQIIFDVSSSFITPFQNNLPNFVTRKKIIGEIIHLDNSNKKINLQNKIVMIENADPGFDWIFSHKIKGLITKYGGSNSHMSIRCSEFSLPAAIGCGEKLFNNIFKRKKIFLDCSLKNIKLLG